MVESLQVPFLDVLKLFVFRLNHDLGRFGSALGNGDFTLQLA